MHRFYPPDEFDELADIAGRKGFKKVASGPFVRSSYNAEELFQTAASQPLTS
jgi:lipoic acid synthetase